MHTKKNINKKRRSLKTAKVKTFSKKDYSSGDGFLTASWGPLVWTFLHIISFNYPVHPTLKEKKIYRDYLYSLRGVLPCKYCRENLSNNLKKMPLTMKHMKNRDTFSKYVYELHNVVNNMLHKECNLSYEEVRDRIENLRSRCTQNDGTSNATTSSATTSKAMSKQKEEAKEGTKEETKKEEKKEKGCTEPLYGKKSKCVINIVPAETKVKSSFQMDKKCIKTRRRF